jgi:hypothetical protein
MLIGKVYRLEKEGCDHCYIGSTYSQMCVRMCHHRQHHRRGERDYKGLFDDGDPTVKILETIVLESKDDVSPLRKAEEHWVQLTDNCINIRRCYISPEEKKEIHDKAVKKYHQSPLGLISTRKASLNQKIKLMNNIKLDKPLMRQINNEIKFLENLQKLMKETNL